MSRLFSGLIRNRYLEEMASRKLDLLIIGGGITGAGIALDGAVRGLDVGLIEMQDFAAGTSSRSTKLIHGGLRYLKQGEVKLVREVGRERAILYKNAPHVVIPEWMLLPIVQGGTYGKWMTSIGLRIYDYLAQVKKNERRVMLSKEEVLAKEPLLRSDILLGGGYYVEYRTDDARLTIEVLKTAFHNGATAVNYTKAESLIYHNGKVIGVNAIDVLTGKTYELYAKKIVNAAGPWVDTIREMDNSKKGKRLHLTKGVHLVVSQSRFPLRQAVYFDTPDGRMMFAIPRDGKTYIGTTDTNYSGPMTQPQITKEDVEYILNGSNCMFPAIGLTENDVESGWAGLRPLIHEDGKSPSELSRKDEIFISDSNLISIAGGKLTGFRKMAERIVDLVCSQLAAETGHSYPKSTTHSLLLCGGNVGGAERFASFCDTWIKKGQELGLSTDKAQILVKRYGSNVPRIYSRIRELEDKAKKYQIDADVLAALSYGIEEEMAARPDDFLVRRTGEAYFDAAGARKNCQAVTRYISDLFHTPTSEVSYDEPAFSCSNHSV